MNSLSRQAWAARNNAEWCDAVCRAHHLTTHWNDFLWTCEGNPPPFYPSAVTLQPGVGGIVAALAPAGFKDSFDDCPVEGYQKLFSASWIWGQPRSTGGSEGWRFAESDGELFAWERAWWGDQSPQGRQFPESLLREKIAFAGRWEGSEVTAGAIYSITGPVVGISNVFGTEDWTQLLGLADRVAPGSPVVGWEMDPEPAIKAGFEVIGTLSVRSA